MIALSDYAGREQSYVKHVFLERYLERLVHKTASIYPHIVYVDGFAGPWQSTNEKFEDTSFRHCTECSPPRQGVLEDTQSRCPNVSLSRRARR